MDATIIARLTRFIIERRCALFVGPDLGESAGGFRGLPTSWQLADELARECGYRGRFLPLPQIAQVYERRRSRTALVGYLHQRLAAAEYQPLPIHQLIARIPFPVIVSGGWDSLLEQALLEQRVSFRTVRLNDDVSFLEPNSRELLVYKPYGSITEPAHMRITENDQLGAFYDLSSVMERVKGVVQQYALLLIGYNLSQDGMFVRIYYDIRRLQGSFQQPAYAVHTLRRPDEGATWQALGIETLVVEDPVLFLRQLGTAVATAEGRVLLLPPLEALSRAPRITAAEAAAQANVFNNMLDQVGVADLIEQTDIPLLSDEQLRDIEAMRAAYERLTRSFDSDVPGMARVWLRLGNLEYARGNYTHADDYYRRALAAEADLAEAHHNLHYVQLAQGDWPGAMVSYQRAIALQPDLALLPERYRIERILGSGELSVVYLATDKLRNTLVAVKLLHRSKAEAERSLALFKREAEVLRSLRHAHIVQMLDFQPYHGTYFIVMEYIQGQSLQSLIHQTAGSISLDQALRMITQVGAALEYAHRRGSIHRDVKPSNILLAGNRAVLIDFGLARPLTSAQQTTLSLSGTLSYAAPEQLQGQPGDARTDVYGLASVLYELLTGRHPAQGSYRPPSEQRPTLNSTLDLVIEKARQLLPSERYPTMLAFLRDLRHAAALQPDFSHAARPLRIATHANQLVERVIERGWWLLLGLIVLLGFVIPAFQPGQLVTAIARYSAAMLAIVLPVSLIIRWYTLAQARRIRDQAVSAAAAFGALLGLALGVGNSSLWLRGFSFYKVADPWRLGLVATSQFLQLLITALVFSLAVTLLVCLFQRATDFVTRRWHTVSALLVFYLFWTGVLYAAALWTEFGWLGNIGVGSMP